MNPSLPYHQAIRGEAEGNPAGAEAMTKDSEEVTIETLLDLSENLSKEWRDVGRKLKLKETDLRNIEADYISNGQKEVVYQMLLLWKQKHGKQATNKTLRDALKAANRKDLSDYLLNREQCGTTSDKTNKTVEQQEDKSKDVSSKGKSKIKSSGTIHEEQGSMIGTGNKGFVGWEKFDIGDEIVEGKRIVLYAAKDLSSSKGIIHIHVGYYWELPGGDKILSKNEVSVLVKRSSIVLKKGKLPLKFQFVKTDPPAWTCHSEEENPKEIPFIRVVTSKGGVCTFVLSIKEGTQERRECTCYFKAGQESQLVELRFILKDGEEDSAANSSDKLVDAGLSQSQKMTGDESLTVKQPREHIDLEVRTEILRDLSEEIQKKWKAVGRKLGLDDSYLDKLERVYTNKEHAETGYRMLLTWKQRNGSQATYRVLGEALNAAGCRDLQENLYHEGNFFPSTKEETYKTVEQKEDKGIDVPSQGKASILTFSHLKKELSLRLTKTDCGDLSRYFSLPPDQVQTIITSPLYSENFLLAIEEKGYIHPSNVNRLTDALTELKINRAHLLTKGYMKLRDPETEYGRFLGNLSAHLTISITEKLCENFKLTDGNKNRVISSQNPGLSFLLTIDEMGIINPSDVSKLATPLEEYRLLQAVAKIHEYQSFVLSDETMPRDEDKEKLFIKCLQQKIKSWFETMTPLPWKKSCQWKSKDLFIASRLVLTNSGSNISSREVDRKCKLHYRDIFTDERLKAETRIILEGQPGSGKTMLSSQLAYDWCCGKLMDIPMVIYLPLKIVDDMTIIQAIKMFYIRKGIPITEEDIESILNSGKKKVCLILDALEEYNHVTKDRSPSEVMRVMTKEKLSNCIVMITARTDYTKHLPPGPMLKIGSFGEDERNEYIEKVFSDDVKRQEEVRELVDNVPFILDLCNIPLLFVLLVHNIDRLKKLQEGQLDKVTPFVKAIVDILCSVQDEEDTSGHLSHQQQESIREEGESRSEREALNMQEEYGVTGAKTAPEWEPDAQSSGHHKHNSTLQREATIKFDFDSFAYHGQGDVSFVSSDSEKDDERYETGAPSTLDQLAFNGLCKGNKQLFWQKNFVDRCVSDSKTWIDAGLLVVEEGTPVNSPDRNLQNDSGSRTTQSLNTSTVTSEIKRGVPPEPDILASDNQSERNPILESKEKKSEPLLNRKTPKYISLQVKFLHKLIQEWFAAKYLARLFWGHKTTEHHYKYQLFREHLANIDPADLHYILRFTCYICPLSFHFIASFLMRDFTTGDGEIPDYIMVCIYLCFAEYDGYKGHKFKDIVKEICRRESVNFSSGDSQLLLRSKVSLLTFASRSKIPIKCLKLSDVVEKITEKALILKADVSLGVLNTLRAIEVSRWDQKLIEQDYEDLIKFIINNEKVEVARLLFPSPPVAVKDEKDLNNLQSRNISVEWIIGAHLFYTLNGTTGEWMMDFRLLGRMSAKLSSLKPITDETNKTVEQQEHKLNDVPSKGKDVSASSLSGIPVPSLSADAPHSKKRRFNESTAVVMDVSTSSHLDSPVPSQSADVPHSKKRRYNEHTAAAMNPSLPSHQAIRGIEEGNPAGAEATTTDSEEVSTETLLGLLEFSGNLFREWWDVGRNLKLDETELETIEAVNRRKGQKEVAYHMLLLWKRKNGMKATNNTLRDALIAANRKYLSDFLLNNREQCGTTSDLYPEKALGVHSVVSEEGRILEIPGTGVTLDIPPGAIDGKCLIEMKIISNYTQEESKSSFTSNTTVVVELLPDNLKLHHRAKLTLPHCLKLKNPVECKALVFSSHHAQGTQPKWRPKQNALYRLNETNCVIWVESFSWETCQIDGRYVEFKKIQVYAACREPDPHIDMELGFYIDLPGKKEIIEKNDLTILQEKPFPFFKEGQLPLKISLEKIRPESWKCTEDTNPKEISFRKIAMSIEDSCPFSFDKVSEKDCTFYFKATQEETIELRVPSKRLAAPHSDSLSLSLTRDVQLSQQTRCNESSKVTNDTLKDLSEKIPANWKDVGSNLGIDEPKLKNLVRDFTNQGHKEIVYQMLLTWKQNNGSKATYKVLGEALIAAGRTDLQEELYDKAGIQKEH